MRLLHGTQGLNLTIADTDHSVPNDYNNIMPRFGFSWSPFAGKNVVHARRPASDPVRAETAILGSPGAGAAGSTRGVSPERPGACLAVHGAIVVAS
jgi:hypothetical protein